MKPSFPHMSEWPRPGSMLIQSRWEWLVGLSLLVAVGWISVQGWRFYDSSLRPYARAAPTAPAGPRTVRADDPAERRRWQAVVNELGAASSALAANRPEWARGHLQRVLELDLGNADALAMLKSIDLTPQPTLTPAQQQERQREARVVEFMGAASTFLEARNPAAARPLLEEALALDPGNQQVQQALSRLRRAP
ncbi:MAG: hypothetical protein ACRDJN_03060 [Chloroflexota bacterium]